MLLRWRQCCWIVGLINTARTWRSATRTTSAYRSGTTSHSWSTTCVTSRFTSRPPRNGPWEISTSRTAANISSSPAGRPVTTGLRWKIETLKTIKLKYCRCRRPNRKKSIKKVLSWPRIIKFEEVRSKNEAKSLLRGHCPLCSTRRFIGALVSSTFGPQCGPGPSKHRLPGALFPQPRSSDDEAYTGILAQLPNQFTSYFAYKADEHWAIKYAACITLYCTMLPFGNI